MGVVLILWWGRMCSCNKWWIFQLFVIIFQLTNTTTAKIDVNKTMSKLISAQLFQYSYSIRICSRYMNANVWRLLQLTSLESASATIEQAFFRFDSSLSTVSHLHPLLLRLLQLPTAILIRSLVIIITIVTQQLRCNNFRQEYYCVTCDRKISKWNHNKMVRRWKSHWYEDRILLTVKHISNNYRFVCDVVLLYSVYRI